MAVKPDFAAVQSAARELQNALSASRGILGSRDRVVDSLKNAAYVLYVRSLNKELEQIPVERLAFASHEVPVEAMKAAGYDNALQVRNASAEELKKVEGMDPKAMMKLFDAIKETRKVAEKRAAIRLSMDHPDGEQTNLVCALYRYMALGDVYAEAAMIETSLEPVVEKSVPAAEKITTSARWFFASRSDKEEVSLAAEEVLRAAASPLVQRISPLQQTYYSVMGMDGGAIWMDFGRRSAEYYARLDQFLDEIAEEARAAGRPVQIPRVPAGSDMLPTEIADQVEEYVLDTTGLKATLRNYQNFGSKYMLAQQRVLLGDEMGLGKTVQAIGAMNHLYASGARHFLVVAPASVLVNWTREVAKFSDITPHLLHGQDFADNLICWYNKGGVGVTNFESVGKILAAKMQDLHLDMVVVDEAHFVKNPEAKRTMNVRQMADAADYAVFMTGTPLENNVTEMRNLIRMLKGSLGSKLSDNADTFEKQACSVYLRRTRADVLKELPEKTETQEWCKLGSAEKKAYNKQVMSKNFMGMRQVSWDVKNPDDSSKAERLREIVEEAVKDGRKVLVFSYFLGTLGKVMDMFGESACGPIDGSVSMERRQEIIDEFTASRDKHVLVAQAISGGTGLNIQAASVVVFCEPQIKPSIETQAIARSYRMGQAHDVLVYRLLAEDTVDERIMEILSDKQEIFDTYAERSLVGSENLKRIAEDQKEADSAKGAEKDASVHQEEIIQAEIERIKAEALEAPDAEEVPSESDDAAEKAVETAENEAPNASESMQMDVKETKAPAKPKTKRRTKSERIRDLYAEGELIRGSKDAAFAVGLEREGGRLIPGKYFIRVLDSREKAALAKVYASGDAMDRQPVREYIVDEAELITLMDGEVITLERADLVRAAEQER